MFLIIVFRKKLFTRLKGPLGEPLPSDANPKSELAGSQQDPVELRAPLTPRRHYVSHELSDNQEVAQELPADEIPPRETRDG